jgi:putative PIN family toxin of toxin-antitoxin system
MQKVIIDTNVLVSALIQRGYPHRIIYELFIADKIQVCVSPPLAAEYRDVLKRPKFEQFREFTSMSEIILADIDAKSLWYYPAIKLDLISDKDDNKILELADECLADFIITGNTTDFTFPRYKLTGIVTPAEYWERYRP